MACYYEKKQIFTASDMLDAFKNNFDWNKFNTPNVEFNPDNAHAYIRGVGDETLESGWVNTGIIVDGLPIYEGFGQMDHMLRYNMPMGSIGSKSASGGLALGLRVPRIRTSHRVDDIDKIRGFQLSGIRAKLTPYQDFQILNFPFEANQQESFMIHPMLPYVPDVPIMWAPLSKEETEKLIRKQQPIHFGVEPSNYLANLIHFPNKQIWAQKIDEMVNTPNIEKSTLQDILGMIQARNAQKAFTVGTFHAFQWRLPDYSADDLKNLIHTFAIDESKVDIPKMRTDRKGVKTLNKKGLHKKKITKSYAKEIASKVWPSVADQKQWTKARLQDNIYQMLTGTESHGGVLNMFREIK